MVPSSVQIRKVEGPARGGWNRGASGEREERSCVQKSSEEGVLGGRDQPRLTLLIHQVRGAWEETTAFATWWSLVPLTNVVLVDGGLGQEKTEVWSFSVREEKWARG